jgi:hypothetical protein
MNVTNIICENCKFREDLLLVIRKTKSKKRDLNHRNLQILQVSMIYLCILE